MEQLEFLKLIVSILEQAGFRYMLVGSFATSYWGEPRTTYDVDVVIAMNMEDVDRLPLLFPERDFYVSSKAATEAVRLRRQFNVIHPDSGNKVDLMLTPDNDWGREQLSRRRHVQFDRDFCCYVASPEDVAISKMLYHQEGGSDKHLRDIAGMLKVLGTEFDRAYVQRWAAKLGVSEIWRAVLGRTELR